MEDGFAYTSKPRSVGTNRKKYRSQTSQGGTPGFNILNDPRVIRGTTCSAETETKNEAAIKSQKSSNQQERPSKRNFQKKKPSSVFDVQEKCQSYIPVPLEQYLVESVEPREAMHVSTQTNAFQPIEKTTTYLPPKSGIDASTQIEEQDQLFNFDAEVTPLLEVLVTKTLDQAMSEVENEAEMQNIEGHLDGLQKEKIKEKEEQDALEEVARTGHRIKHEQLRHSQARLNAELKLESKVVAVQSSKLLIDHVKQSATRALEDAGVFYDPLEKQIEVGFLDWAYSGADATIQNTLQARNVANHMVLSSMIHANNQHARDDEGFVRIFVEGKGLGVDMIGPIPISEKESNEAIEAKIQKWMHDNVGPSPVPPGGYLALIADTGKSLFEADLSSTHV